MVKIYVLHNLFTAFLSLVPKKLRSLLPPSWYPHYADNFNKNPQPSPEIIGPEGLKRVFKMFDRNGDGRITKEELNDSLENLGLFIPEKEYKIDSNGDGCIDMNEFESLYRSIMGDNEEEDDTRDAFDVFDQDGDGFITVEELKSVIGSLGFSQGKSLDGDGRINYNEFLQMMKSG